MKITIDEEEIYDLDEIKRKVICHDIKKEQLDEHIKERVKWSVEHKYEQCLMRMKEKWIPVLSSENIAVPESDDEFATIIFGRSDYKDRDARDAEEKAKLEEQNRKAQEKINKVINADDSPIKK